MQRYIILRVAQGILAIFIISTITFALARVSGDPLNVLLPEEASEEQIELTKKEWGLTSRSICSICCILGNCSRAIWAKRWRGPIPQPAS